MSKTQRAGVALVVFAALLPVQPMSAAPSRDVGAGQAADTTDISAQAVVRRRPRTRIIVRPLRSDTGIYPSPAPYNYPGPNAVRDCDSMLAREFRPSGTVIVPRMRCWWEIPR